MSKTSELQDLPKRRGSLKFKLTYAQVLSLSVDRIPVMDKAGKVKLVERALKRPANPTVWWTEVTRLLPVLVFGWGAPRPHTRWSSVGRRASAVFPWATSLTWGWTKPTR